MDVEEWERAGLYRPGAPEADERRALLEYLSARGATIEQMVQAHRLGILPAVAGDLVMETSGASPSVERSRTAAVSPWTVCSGCCWPRACPSPPTASCRTTWRRSCRPSSRGPRSWARMPSSPSPRARGGGHQHRRGRGRALLRRAGSRVRARGIGRSGAGPGVGDGDAGIHRRPRRAVESVASGVRPRVPPRCGRAGAGRLPTGAGGGRRRTRRGPSEVVALGFVDLVGSAAWAEGLSLRDHSLALSRFESAAWSSAVLAGGRVVKMIGDEVFFAAPSVDVACRIGAEVCRRRRRTRCCHRLGVPSDFGAVTPREGDYFGPLVNVVSRLVKTAEPGAMAVTEEAAAALPRSTGPSGSWARSCCAAWNIRSGSSPSHAPSRSSARQAVRARPGQLVSEGGSDSKGGPVSKAAPAGGARISQAPGPPPRTYPS